MTEVKPYKKMMIFSHDDLDGMMAPVILSCFLDQDATLTVKHCKTGKYGTIDAEITSFLSQEDASSYNGICVTDLVPSDEVMADLHAFAKTFDIELRVFDHHQTAEHLMSLYPGEVFVYPRHNGSLTSATSVVFHHYMGVTPEAYLDATFSKTNRRKFKRVAEFASIVRSWDCWDWTNDANDRWGEQASDFNSLCHLIGRELFLQRFSVPHFWDNEEAIFSKTDRLLMDIENTSRDKYVQSHVERTQFQVLELDRPYHVAYVTAESYKSILGNAMCKLTHPATGELVDFAIISDNGYLSLRSIGDMNVADIAKKYFNGGGHANAAGGFVPFDTFHIISNAAKAGVL